MTKECKIFTKSLVKMDVANLHFSGEGTVPPKTEKKSLPHSSTSTHVLKPPKSGISLLLLFAFKKEASSCEQGRLRRSNPESQKDLISKGPSLFALFPDSSQAPLVRPFDFLF